MAEKRTKQTVVQRDPRHYPTTVIFEDETNLIYDKYSRLEAHLRCEGRQVQPPTFDRNVRPDQSCVYHAQCLYYLKSDAVKITLNTPEPLAEDADGRYLSTIRLSVYGPSNESERHTLEELARHVDLLRKK